MKELNTDMNCEQYKQAIAADPSESFDGGTEHANACGDCRGLRDGYRSIDARIESALKVTVPPLKMPVLPEPDAADKSDNVVSMKPRRRLATPTWIGLAAGFALAAYFGLLTLNNGSGDLPLADQVIAHFEHEADSRIVTDVAVSERTLDSVVSNDVEEMGSGVGLVTYARNCVINGNSIPHLVIQGEKGPVTLLLLPDEQIDQAIRLDSGTVNGVILPNGRGSIAIVGGRDEQLEQIGNRVVNSVKWKT